MRFFMKHTCWMPVIIAFIVVAASSAHATPQELDGLQYGYKTYPMFQKPMTALWYYGDGDLPPGKSRPPAFEVTSSTNWAGYFAEWQIRGDKLRLTSIQGRIQGKEVENEEILPSLKFPATATWFTGRIYLPIGEFDEETQEYESVLVFEIENGIVTSKTYHPSCRIARTFDGR